MPLQLKVNFVLLGKTSQEIILLPLLLFGTFFFSNKEHYFVRELFQN